MLYWDEAPINVFVLCINSATPTPAPSTTPTPTQLVQGYCPSGFVGVGSYHTVADSDTHAHTHKQKFRHWRVPLSPAKYKVRSPNMDAKISALRPMKLCFTISKCIEVYEGSRTSVKWSLLIANSRQCPRKELHCKVSCWFCPNYLDLSTNANFK